MTTAYLGGQPTTLTIDLIDGDGSPITANSVDYRLLNQNETELIAKAPVSSFVACDTSVTVTIIGTLNALTPPNTRELRQIELYVYTDVGAIKINQEYFIEGEEVLVEGVNSFQGYSMSLLVALDLDNIDGWLGATKQQRISALVRARQNIGHLRFRYIFDAYQNIVDNTLGVADLTLATPAQYFAFPVPFVEALRRAQILEADLILNGDQIGDIRRDGLMSMTVGEAKQFFRPTKPLDLPVGKRTMKELAKWVLSRHRISRT